MTPPFRLSDADVRALGEGEIVLRDDAFPAASVRACSSQIGQMDADRPFARAGMGASTRKHTASRGDRTAWDDEIPGQLLGLRALFDEVRLELNEAAWMGLAAFTVQLAIYDADGAAYVAHRDAMRGDPARRATAILYLNPAWEPAHGGCLRVYPPSGTRDVEPLGGRLVLFRSDCLLHEVLPSLSTRHAATAWYRGRSADPTRNAAQD